MSATTANHFSRYAVADNIPVKAGYVLPVIPCGVYHATDMFGEVTELIFRYIPRAAHHAGKFGVFYKDQDAGMVLIGLYDPQKGDVRRVGTLYPDAWGAWIQEDKVLVKKACAWCGRALGLEGRMTHLSKACDRETNKNS